jgi:predicted metalloprotease with PDZ domain
MPRSRLVIAGAVLIACALDVHAQQARSDSHCDAPAYLGICDPYVPGTKISFEPKELIRVVDTWHRGPAERAGVCPGDTIVAVNGVLASANTSDRMLHEIVSATPSPVLLTVKRGEQTMGFRVRRVRESTLAKLSHQKFIRDANFLFSQILVPRGEKRAEHAQYIEFLKQLEEREGFERIEGLAVPVATPPEQVTKLKEFLLPGGQENHRLVRSLAGGPYSLGFSVLMLKEPSEVLIEAVTANSSAHRAGLLPGDRVLRVDGEEVSAMAFSHLGALLFWRQSLICEVEVERAGQDEKFLLQAGYSWDLTRPIWPIADPARGSS